MINIEVIHLADLSIRINNLEVRNMSVSCLCIIKRYYILIISNTIGNKEIFIFNFDFSENEKIAHFCLNELVENSAFIAISNTCIYYKEEVFIYEGLSNGNLFIQKLNIDVEVLNIKINEKQHSQYKLHQAGINQLISKIKENSTIILFSAGEDNCILISEVDNSMKLTIIQKISNYHSSPIKSIDFTNNLIFTCGYDQLLNVLFKPNDSCFTKFQKFNICLSEVNSISVSYLNNNDNKYLVILAGQGIEFYSFSI